LLEIFRENFIKNEENAAKFKRIYFLGATLAFEIDLYLEVGVYADFFEKDTTSFGEKIVSRQIFGFRSKFRNSSNSYLFTKSTDPCPTNP
jgi:hypothetical protein